MTQRVSWKDKAIVFTSNQNRHSLVRQETIADSGQQEDRDRSNTGPRGPSQQSFDSGIQNKSFSSSFGESFDTQKGLLESKNDASSRKASFILHPSNTEFIFEDTQAFLQIFLEFFALISCSLKLSGFYRKRSQPSMDAVNLDH